MRSRSGPSMSAFVSETPLPSKPAPHGPEYRRASLLGACRDARDVVRLQAEVLQAEVAAGAAGGQRLRRSVYLDERAAEHHEQRAASPLAGYGRSQHLRVPPGRPVRVGRQQMDVVKKTEHLSLPQCRMGHCGSGAVVEKLAGRRYCCKQAAKAAALFLIWLDNIGLVERKITFKASLARPALMMLRAWLVRDRQDFSV